MSGVAVRAVIVPGNGSGDVTRLILMLIKFKLTLSSASILKQIFNSVNEE